MRGRKRQAPKRMNKFSFYSLSGSPPTSLPALDPHSLARFPELLAVKSIFPKIPRENAETEAKHHTQWYNVFLPPAQHTTPPPQLRNWIPQKYHTFISLSPIPSILFWI